MTLIDNAQPVVHAALGDNVELELQRMEKLGIIKKVLEPTMG